MSRRGGRSLGCQKIGQLFEQGRVARLGRVADFHAVVEQGDAIEREHHTEAASAPRMPKRAMARASSWLSEKRRCSGVLGKCCRLSSQELRSSVAGAP